MKILQLVPYFYPAWAYGGPAKLVYDTSTYFASQGHEVTVYTSDAYDNTRRMPKNKYVSKKNLIVKYFKNLNNTLAYTLNIFITPGLFFPSVFEIKKFDAIHIHDFYTLQNAWVAWWAWVFKVPYILSVHGCLEDKRLMQKSMFKKLYLLFFGRWMLAHATAVIATSKNEKKAYKEFGVPSSSIFSAGHGIDKKEFYTALSKLESRKLLGLPLKHTIITYLGRIHSIKGLDVLVQAIAQLSTEKIHFVIAGSDDGYLPELKRLIKKHGISKQVTLRGTCYGETKARLFKASDGFVYPSYSEGFSLGILEALAAGLPLVITKGCHFDLVKDENAGQIVNSDPIQLSQAIRMLAHDSSLKKIQSFNARHLIDTHYSLSKVGDELLAIYAQAVRIAK